MSTKTYAGFRSVRQYGTQHSLSGRDGFSITPTDDDDEHIYRSRLGYPWSNSGPWMTVQRVIDVNTPSTDGTFDISIGQASGVAIEIWTAEYCMARNARYTYTTRGGKRYLRLQYNESAYTKAEYASRNIALVWGYRFGLLTAYLPEEAWPFTVNELRAIYSQPHDFAKAYHVASISRMIGTQLEHEVTVDIQLQRDPVRNVTWFNLDLTPSEALFSDVRESAEMYLLTGILPGSWAMGWETAYTEACKNMPQAATNVAANVLEAAALLTALFTGDILGELPKNARDAWLTYRYVYTTTRLDISEIQSTFKRLDALQRSNTVAVYGSYTRGDITYRVGFDIDIAQIVPQDVSTTLQKFGLELNALNVWDMIPYSFVVDWFLPISDIIEYFQDLSACRYEPKDRWFSLVTTRDGYRCYVRLPGRELSTMPYLQISHAGTKTICLRIADAVALFAP